MGSWKIAIAKTHSRNAFFHFHLNTYISLSVELSALILVFRGVSVDAAHQKKHMNTRIVTQI